MKMVRIQLASQGILWSAAIICLFICEASPTFTLMLLPVLAIISILSFHQARKRQTQNN